MSYNGSGTFVVNSSGQPVVTGTVISSTAFNALTADLATGLSTAITKDGQTTTTARILFAQGVSSTLVTDATSATTGSIITAGGISCQKALFVGTTATVTGAVSLAGITATSLALGGATLGSNALAVTGTTQLNSALNYGGVTLSNAVTGTGNMVLSASPTLTGTLTAAAANFSGTVAVTGGNLNVGNVLGSGVASFYKDNTPSYVAGVGTVVPGGSAASALIFSDYQGSWVERMRLDSSGNLGIGTSSPSGKLQIVSANNTDTTVIGSFDANNQSQRIQIGFQSIAQYSSADPIRFLTGGLGGTERMRLSSAGLLGIGMTPSNVLDITQSQNAASLIKILNTNASGSALVGFQSQNASHTADFQMLGTGYTPAGMLLADMLYLHTDGAGGMAIISESGGIKFGTGGYSYTEVARIGTDGSFLVGSTTNVGAANIAFGTSSGPGMLKAKVTTISNSTTETIMTMGASYGGLIVVNISSSSGYQRTDLILGLNGAVSGVIGTVGSLSSGSISYSASGPAMQITNSVGATIVVSAWMLGSAS